ncbi:hypothetical protein BCR33DRAFT_854565 [Rhizoclosmatium globosum]|uniref:Roadblock/LAMTOR2 domain-containing protein n=1 Tax=Rhizoclosmatium globosum TaxID=329046 RepID=A0A1Y2BSU3_9FUNG|nr:hypothetical protein BCR33DRAFT_854565 [Rhizoclosmatium globosum]|eukprot:ORY37813.1 hypothetical protein BCR33DRAFT_854565 [Rhizoclosmatium globosum]
MLKSRVLTDVLSQANSNGVNATLLLNPDGGLVGFAGGTESEARKHAAVVSNIWVAYERHTGEGLSARRGTGGNGSTGAGGTSVASITSFKSPSSSSPNSIVGPAGVPKDEEGLRSVVVQLEHGKISIASVAGKLLCLIANEQVEFGMLNAKTRTLKTHLEGPLSLVSVQ